MVRATQTGQGNTSVDIYCMGIRRGCIMSHTISQAYLGHVIQFSVFLTQLNYCADILQISFKCFNYPL